MSAESSALLLALSAGLVLLCSVLLLSLGEVRGRIADLLGGFTIAYALVVLVLELAGLLRALAAGPVLLLQLAITSGVLLVWIRRHQPTLLAPLTASGAERLSLRRVSSAGRRYPLVFVLGLAVLLVHLRNAQLILTVPEYEVDSLSYHLARAAFWKQYQSLQPWPTPYPPQVAYPMNAELGLLWTFLWWGSDELAGFVQWFSGFAAALGICGLVRLLGHSRAIGLLTGLLWLTLTQVLYQSTSAQNDLLTAAFCITTVYFLFAWFHRPSRSLLVLACTSFGLAIGTKGIILLLLPGMALMLTLLLWRPRKQARQWTEVRAWLLGSLLGLLLFGAYAYVQNIVFFGDPLGPSSYTERMIARGRSGEASGRWELLRENLGRYAYQLVDLSPLPFRIGRHLNPAKAWVFDKIFSGLDIDVENRATIEFGSFDLARLNVRSKSQAWFGPLGVLAVAAAVSNGLLGRRRADVLRLTLAVLPASFLVLHSAAQAWDPAAGRYYLTPMALSFPLLAPWLSLPGIEGRVWRAITIGLGLTVLLTMYVHIMDENHLRWNALSLGARQEGSWMNRVTYKMVAENVPLDASLGVVISPHHGFRLFPLFGARLQRRLTLAPPDNENLLPSRDVESFWREFEASDYRLFESDRLGGPRAAPGQDLSLLLQNGNQSLWTRSEHRRADACDEDAWPIRPLVRSSEPAICARFPLVLGLGPQEWGDRFTPSIGAGPARGLGLELLVREDANAVFSIDVNAGDEQGPRMLQFAVSLRPQAYTLNLHLADGSEPARVEKILIDLR